VAKRLSHQPLGVTMKNYLQPLYYIIGVDDWRIELSAAMQNNSQWCWAACIQILFKYYRMEVSQEEIVNRTMGKTDADLLPNIPGNIKNITENLNNWSFDKSGYLFRVQALSYIGAPKPSFLIKELSTKHPIMIGYKTKKNSDHAVIIISAKCKKELFSNNIESIMIYDPYPGMGYQEYPGLDLAKRISAYWYIRVHDITWSI
jgi:hypothetical protein